MATLYTCSLNCVYCPHSLVQWSCHCPCKRIPAHSPWLPGYINVAQTILVVLTVAGLFPDRPRVHKDHHSKVFVAMICRLCTPVSWPQWPWLNSWSFTSSLNLSSKYQDAKYNTLRILTITAARGTFTWSGEGRVWNISVSVPKATTQTMDLLLVMREQQCYTRLHAGEGLGLGVGVNSKWDLGTILTSHLSWSWGALISLSLILPFSGAQHVLCAIHVGIDYLGSLTGFTLVVGL